MGLLLRDSLYEETTSPVLLPYDCSVGNNYMNNHVHRAPFSDIERKKEVTKSEERRKEIHTFINY